MGLSVVQRYTNPTTGIESQVTVSFTVEEVRLDDAVGSAKTPVLKATAAGTQTAMESVEDIVTNLLDGKPSSPSSGVYACEIPEILAQSEEVLNLTATLMAQLGDPVEDDYLLLMSDVDELGEVVLVTTVAGNDLSLQSASGTAGPDNDYSKGSIVINLTRSLPRILSSSLGISDALGVKAQKEQLTAPTVTAAKVSGSEARIRITDAGQIRARYYDVYMFNVDPGDDVIINRVPDVADLDVASLGFSGTFYDAYATTWGGGSDAGGGDLSSGTYFATAVAKDGTGGADVVESDPAEAVEVDLS